MSVVMKMSFYLTVLGIFIRYVNVHLNVLNIRWTRTVGHARESIWLQTVMSFFTSRRCVYVNFILAYVTIGSYISRVSTNYTFATVYKGRHTKEMSVIDEPAHVAVGLQLLEMTT